MAKKDDKSDGQKLEEKLLIKPGIVGENDSDLLKEAQGYGEEYKQFLCHKTEREIVDYTVPIVEKLGYTKFVLGTKYKPGQKVYFVNRNKNLITMTFGKRPLVEGVRISVAHADSPRLDFKPNPLFEAEDMAYFKTHYYGGIKKYQWTTIPLSIHGVVAKKDGSVITVRIGDEPSDPCFIVTDLLIHLSAELTMVPADPAREIGFDRSLIAAYGHDDRVCAWASFEPLLDMETPEHTAVCVLADKEEIGSVGVSGMQSHFFETFMADVCECQQGQLRRCLERSFCLSCDVSNAFDPIYAETCDKRNNSQINYGIALCKYTGSRGKGGCSDASGEVMGRIRRLFDDNGVIWQTAELGKVDQGGGGTVAAYMANRNIDTLDAGVPVLSMHAPMEVVSKLDCYMTMKGMKAVYHD